MGEPAQALDEGSDLTYICETADQFILESVSEVDDEHILARVVGESFFLNKASRNRRFYTDTLWRKVLDQPHVAQKFEDRLMYGTIGHKQTLDDTAIAEGKVSHIVTRMWIDEDTQRGMAEFLILNTPTGRVLNTLLRAKSKLYTSTRAKGTFSPKKDSEGNQYVNEDNFSFETIDFVYNPGFLQSRPDLVEELQDDLNLIEGIEPMADKDQNAELIAEEFRAQRKTIDDLQEQLGASRQEVKSLTAQVDESKQAVALVPQYETLGTPQEIEEKLSRLKALESESNQVAESVAAAKILEEFGSPEEVKSLIESANQFMEDFGQFEDAAALLRQHQSVLESLGTPEQIQEHMSSYLNMVESGITDPATASEMANLMTEEFGSVAEGLDFINKVRLFEAEAGEMDTALDAMRNADEFFKSNDPGLLIQESNQLREFTEEFGSLPDIRKALILTHAYAKNIQEEKENQRIAGVAEELGIDEAKVRKLLDKGFSQDEIAEMFEGVAAKADDANESDDASKVEESRRVKSRISGQSFIGEAQDEATDKAAEAASLQEALDKVNGKNRVTSLINTSR